MITLCVGIGWNFKWDDLASLSLLELFKCCMTVQNYNRLTNLKRTTIQLRWTKQTVFSLVSFYVSKKYFGFISPHKQYWQFYVKLTLHNKWSPKYFGYLPNVFARMPCPRRCDCNGKIWLCSLKEFSQAKRIVKTFQIHLTWSDGNDW